MSRKVQRCKLLLISNMTKEERIFAIRDEILSELLKNRADHPNFTFNLYTPKEGDLWVKSINTNTPYIHVPLDRKSVV